MLWLPFYRAMLIVDDAVIVVVVVAVDFAAAPYSLHPGGSVL